MRRARFLLGLLLLVAACAPAQEAVTPIASRIAALPAATLAVQPTASRPLTVPAATPAPATPDAPSPRPTGAPAPVALLDIAGRTADGAYTRGLSDAPLVMIDYSDFL